MAKLYQYLAIGNPIIMFGPAGEITYVVERIGAGWRIAHGDSRELHTFIDEARHQAFTDYRARASQWLAAHTRVNLAEKPFSMLTQIEKGMPPTPTNIPKP